MAQNEIDNVKRAVWAIKGTWQKSHQSGFSEVEIMLVLEQITLITLTLSERILTHYSQFHITLILPECLLCEHKHITGLNPGMIPGWGSSNFPGSVPEWALCEPDQCCNGVFSDDVCYCVTVLPGVLEADQHSRRKICVNWNEAKIRELLTIRAEAETVR